ncbi:hypothetical protein A3A50_03345 [Candidatus Woesebacteria bacterium RIFCSPLOWO2_01_FULL_38_20]|nr:MAG: hypothetical protein A3A50_03345 [Candidatus Woesebacteria bacterium RIFCSPLOWO2_01_FULL_38_20]
MNHKLKIALLVPRYGLVDRGVENFTKEFVNYLKEDFDFEIYAWKSFTKNFKPPLQHTELEMFIFSLLSFPRLLFGNYDLIFPQNGMWGAIFARMIRALKGTPFIYRSAGGKEPMIVRQKPNIYIATTSEIKIWIEKFDSEQKVLLIPNGVDLKKFHSRPALTRARRGRPALPRGRLQRPVYLCVGALIPAKRINLAINAVVKLKRGSLMVLGKGPLEMEIKSLGLKVLGRKRFVLKGVAYEKMSGYYQFADAFTLPSLEEPFGIVYLEAMASGLPVVAPDDETRRYIIGKGGQLCKVEDINEYSRILESVIKKNFDGLPRAQAEKFSWNIISKKYSNIINTLVSASGKNLGN